MRTLVVSSADFAGERLEHPSDLGHAFVAGRCRLTAEPGHDAVLRLLRAGLLDVVIIGASGFVGLWAEGESVKVSRLCAPQYLHKWIGDPGRRKEIP